MENNCGGCAGKGAHRRWCPIAFGFVASMYGDMAEQLDSMGDRATVNHSLQNQLWLASGLARVIAERAKARHLKEVQSNAERGAEEEA